jgi:hypothetical protein
MDNVESIILTTAMIFFLIGSLKLHRSARLRSSFIMLFSFILFLICGVIYIVSLILVTFYWSPDNAPKLLSYALAFFEPITSLLFLIGSAGFLGFAWNYAKKNKTAKSI